MISRVMQKPLRPSRPRIAVILGTRPEIIKMAPIVREFGRRGVDFFVLHTGQHYSPNMDRAFFSDLGLPRPKYNLNVGGHPYRKQVGLMSNLIARVLSDEKPDIVLVQGDTVSVLAGALAASKLGIPVAHHEAGLRSHDLTMLEETNRIVTDHISDFLFAPTPSAVRNLKEEGYAPERIFHTGNTIVDAVRENLALARRRSRILKRFKLTPRSYFLVTAHRAENVDKPERLEGILAGLADIFKKFHAPILFSLHPRTKQRIRESRTGKPQGVRFLAPLGYLDFLELERNARLILTDSGGIQEEACVLKVPCVTLRDNTERPETLRSGANMLAGASPRRILRAAETMLRRRRAWKNPFGDGKAAKRIASVLLERW